MRLTCFVTFFALVQNLQLASCLQLGSRQATVIANRFYSGHFKATVNSRQSPSGSIFTLTSSASLESAVEKPKIFEPFGKGLLRDIKTKLPYYKSDFTDGFNIKSVASIFFLFFACLAPAVAFGGLLGLATNGNMGTVEALGATAIGGVLYALLSAQPITIIGTTGPLLAFLKVLYDACVANNLPFLPIYAWVGLWSSLFLYLSAFFSTSNLVEYFTRFTDDIFSALISVIYIYEAFSAIKKIFTNPMISGLQATFSLILAGTTFFTASTLAGLRQSTLFDRKVRNTLADFAPTIGVAAGIGASMLATQRYGISLPKLAIPVVLQTTSCRPWLVDIFSVSHKVKLLCIFPAIMATVLLFMDQNITVRLVMAKEYKLKKGSGLHLDLLIMAFVTTITSLLGMPWTVAATVGSLAHMRSLQIFGVEEQAQPQQSADPVEPSVKGIQDVSTAPVVSAGSTGVLKMIGVQEQRVTGLMIHGLMGASIIFCRNLLRQIPVSVLTGLFMYLGVSSIDKTDFFARVKLFVTDDRDAPKTPLWAQRVALGRTKLFTGIQLVLLASMFWIKGTSIGVLFPVLIGLLAPVRVALEKFNVFSKDELDVLDGEF